MTSKQQHAALTITVGKKHLDDLKNLEQRVDDLIRLCGRLKHENEELRSRREALLQEHTKLTEKNRMARSRLETIIGRLRAMEKG